MIEPISSTEHKLSFLLNLRSRGIRDLDLLRAFETVNRKHFLDRRYHDLASSDISLPIECGQTQIAPSLIATMINLLEVRQSNRVLEIGTGSGYSAAILGTLARYVVSVERFQSLALGARVRLANLLIEKVTVVVEDGRDGLPLQGPFDRIVFTGSISEVTDGHLRQLSPEGILVAVEFASGTPLLCRYRKGVNTFHSPEIIGPFPMVPLIPGISISL
jgi:protein-L-isoaspartate(D-aspartate) O-methyltransferase